MNHQQFATLLEEMDPAEMAQHSVHNHHVDGLDYLCLHRSDKLTVKLYFIDPYVLTLEPGEFLVTPHTHRYAFESRVLVGRLGHVRFEENFDYQCVYSKYRYSPEIRERHLVCDTYDLTPTVQYYMPGKDGAYWNSTKDIHTLMVPDRFVLLGLVQFADTLNESTVYIRQGSEMKYPKSRPLSPEEAEKLRCQAIGALKAVQQ